MVAVAMVVLKLSLSLAVTSLPRALRRYATHPEPEKASNTVSNSIPDRTSWIQGRSRNLLPMKRSCG